MCCGTAFPHFRPATLKRGSSPPANSSCAGGRRTSGQGQHSGGRCRSQFWPRLETGKSIWYQARAAHGPGWGGSPSAQALERTLQLPRPLPIACMLATVCCHINKLGTRRELIKYQFFVFPLPISLATKREKHTAYFIRAFLNGLPLTWTRRSRICTKLRAYLSVSMMRRGG